LVSFNTARAFGANCANQCWVSDGCQDYCTKLLEARVCSHPTWQWNKAEPFHPSSIGSEKLTPQACDGMECLIRGRVAQSEPWLEVFGRVEVGFLTTLAVGVGFFVQPRMSDWIVSYITLRN